jgi:hypothetical protein
MPSVPCRLFDGNRTIAQTHGNAKIDESPKPMSVKIDERQNRRTSESIPQSKPTDILVYCGASVLMISKNSQTAIRYDLFKEVSGEHPTETHEGK